VTLIELVVGLLVSVIVIASASGIIVFATRMLAHDAAGREQADIAEAVLGLVADELRYATEVEALPASQIAAVEDAGGGWRLLCVGDPSGRPAVSGMLWIKHADASSSPWLNAFGPGFYRENTVKIAYRVDRSGTGSSKAVTLDVAVTGPQGGPAVVRSRTLLLVNVAPGSAPDVAEDGAEYPRNGSEPFVLRVQR
jgi:hypothetical protein